MGLGCPSLLGSSARGLRRCAATLPRLLGRTFPGFSSFSVLLEAMGAVRDSVIGHKSSEVHLRIQTFHPGEMSTTPGVVHILSRKYCRQLWYGLFPNCYTHLHSWAVLRWAMAMTAQVIPGCIVRCHPVFALQLPLC